MNAAEAKAIVDKEMAIDKSIKFRRWSGSQALRRIAGLACEIRRVSPVDFAGQCRHPDVVAARWLYAAAARALTTASFPEIARAVRRSSHTSLFRGAKRFNRPDDIEQIRRRLEGGAA